MINHDHLKTPVPMTEEEVISKWKGDIAKPLVSICCITYNQINTISETINGFLIQVTEFPFEIVVHDDASNDGTSELIRDYKERYPKIIKHICQHENQYSRGRRILGLAMAYANAQYIAICEGDDYWTDPEKLQKQVNFLENNPEYVITYHDSQPFDESGDLDLDFGGATRDLSSLELQKATPIYTLTACFRNVIREFPPEFSVARYGDMFCWSMLGNHGKGKFMRDIAPAKYRVHEHGVFSKADYKKKIEMKLLTDTALLAYYSRINKKDLAGHFRQQVLVSSIIMSNYFNLLRVIIKDVRVRARSAFHKLININNS